MASKAKKRKSPEARFSGTKREVTDRLAYEHAAWSGGVFRFAGVDEAGRGPLAGPVVAAAAVFTPSLLEKGVPDVLLELNDSKQLTAAKRARLRLALEEMDGVEFGIGILSPQEIDELNILRATHKAMALALNDLPHPADEALVDGLPVPGLPCKAGNLVKGDSKCFSIAAASILAKETRDDLMKKLDVQYPGYGFAAHKGYGTKKHREALQRLGPCPAHRTTFAPVRNLLEPELDL